MSTIQIPTELTVEHLLVFRRDMNLDLQATCRYWTEREGRARCPTYGCGTF